ncbi:hypothetical protein PFISCL1PPCAC_3506, partial [Pristionchus fissidentatus]
MLRQALVLWTLVFVIILFVWKGKHDVKLQKIAYSLPEVDSNLDILMTIRATSQNYESRLRYSLETWWKSVSNVVYVISDDVIPEQSLKMRSLLGDHLIETSCGPNYSNPSLACKCQAELDLFYKAEARWSCRMDDDSYVNLPVLKRTLARYNADVPMVIGRITAKPLPLTFRGKKHDIVFPTGNALCMSFPLVKCL